jgi:hypothetical protein
VKLGLVHRGAVSVRRCLNLLAAGFTLSSLFAAGGEVRQIRLRNETITTPPRA